MTVAQFVRAECANSRHGKCLFAPKCTACAGERCCVAAETWQHDKAHVYTDYFSKCVAPLALSMPEYAEAANKYAEQCGESPVAAERACACGQPMSKGKQCCDLCRKKRHARSKRKWRG